MTTQVNSTVLGNIGNLTANNISGTITTSSQPNITSIGTLASLTVSGNISGTITTASQTNITGVGNLTSGTWSANTITPNRGGTGLTAPGNSGNVLTSNGTAWASAALPTTKTGAGVLTASGQTFTILTGSSGKCLIQLTAGFVALYANWGTCTVNMIIGGATVATDTATHIEYGSRMSGDHAILLYQYSGAANASVTVTFTFTLAGSFTRAFYSYIGT